LKLIKKNIKNKMSRDEIKKLIKKFDTIKILRTILHGQHILRWRREKRGGRKIIVEAPLRHGYQHVSVGRLPTGIKRHHTCHQKGVGASVLLARASIFFFF
jgi:hypothetical protein